MRTLAVMLLLALAAFSFGLYMDVTTTRCQRGTITAALGLCGHGD